MMNAYRVSTTRLSFTPEVLRSTYDFIWERFGPRKREEKKDRCSTPFRPGLEPPGQALLYHQVNNNIPTSRALKERKQC